MGIQFKPSQKQASNQSSSITAMNSFTIFSCFVLLLTSIPEGRGGPHSRGSTAPTKTIAELAIATPQLSTLLAAVKAEGLVETLSGEGPFTVFAPTNKAFAKIPAETVNSLLADKEALTKVLLRHVVPGAALEGKDVPHGTTALATAGGETINVSRNRFVKIISEAGEAHVVAFDVLATNGVVHFVDTVF